MLQVSSWEGRRPRLERKEAVQLLTTTREEVDDELARRHDRTGRRGEGERGEAQPREFLLIFRRKRRHSSLGVAREGKRGGEGEGGDLDREILRRKKAETLLSSLVCTCKEKKRRGKKKEGEEADRPKVAYLFGPNEED